MDWSLWLEGGESLLVLESAKDMGKRQSTEERPEKKTDRRDSEEEKGLKSSHGCCLWPFPYLAVLCLVEIYNFYTTFSGCFQWFT